MAQFSQTSIKDYAVGPIVMSVAGDEYIQAARILGIIWEAASTSSDTVELRCRQTGHLLWFGRTDSTQTYLGIQFGSHGLHAPHGFKLIQISSGRVLIYLREE